MTKNDKMQELRDKLSLLSQTPNEEVKVEEEVQEPLETPVLEVAEVVEEEPSLDNEEEIVVNEEESVPNLMQQASELIDKLSPEEIGMFKKMMEVNSPEEIKDVKPLVPIEVSEPKIDEENEENKRIEQLNSETIRLRDNGAYRVEVIYQLLGINSNLNRIATALEK